jgi:hypothetical protein
MREITQEELNKIVDKIRSGPPISEWDGSYIDTFIDGNKLIFACRSEEDAERVLYAMLSVISG